MGNRRWFTFVELLPYKFVQICKVYNGWLSLLYPRDDMPNNLYAPIILPIGHELS